MNLRYFSFLFLCLLFSLSGVVIFATNSTSLYLEISGVAPSIESLEIRESRLGSPQSTLHLQEGESKLFYLYGSAFIPSTCEDLQLAENYEVHVFYGDSTSSCEVDGVSCLSFPTDEIEFEACHSPEDTSLDFFLPIELPFYMKASDEGSSDPEAEWTLEVALEAESGGSASRQLSFEVASLLAFDTEESVSYGELSKGKTSSHESLRFSQTGNTAVHTGVESSSFLCSEGSIPLDNIELSLSPGFSFGSGASLEELTTLWDDGDGSPMSLFLEPQDNSWTSSQIFVSTLLKLPSNGVKGACSGAVTFTATPYED